MKSTQVIAAAALLAVAAVAHSQAEKPQTDIKAQALADPQKAPPPVQTKPVQTKPVQHKPFASVTDVVTAAHADAIKRLGDKAAKLNIQLLTAENATWQDGSLGCPEKGMNYTQAMVAGYRVRIRVGGEDWDYHASRRGALVLCPVSRARTPAPDSRD